MYEPSFFKRVRNLGLRNIVLSWDTLAGVVTFFLVFIYTGGGFIESDATPILGVFAAVSASLFAIVLTGFTIITSFTDRMFLYAWKEVGEFDNIVTTFQYNLGLPLLVLLFSLFLHIAYNELAMLVLVALFVYMVFSMLDLVGLISRYALQRGEFVKQQVEDSAIRENDQPGMLSNEELRAIRKQLAKAENLKEEDEE